MRSKTNFVVSVLGFAFLAIVFVGSASAQGRRGGTPEEQKAAFDANFVELTTTLALSDEQAPKVKAILWTAQEKRGELMASMRGSGGGAGNLARGAMREKMAEMDKQTLTSLGTVLTPEQIKKYEEFQESRRRGGQGRRPGQGAGNPQ
jgi:transposase